MNIPCLNKQLLIKGIKDYASFLQVYSDEYGLFIELIVLYYRGMKKKKTFKISQFNLLKWKAEIAFELHP